MGKVWWELHCDSRNFLTFERANCKCGILSFKWYIAYMYLNCYLHTQYGYVWRRERRVKQNMSFCPLTLYAIVNQLNSTSISLYFPYGCTPACFLLRSDSSSLCIPWNNRFKGMSTNIITFFFKFNSVFSLILKNITIY